MQYPKIYNRMQYFDKIFERQADKSELYPTTNPCLLQDSISRVGRNARMTASAHAQRQTGSKQTHMYRALSGVLHGVFLQLKTCVAERVLDNSAFPDFL